MQLSPLAVLCAVLVGAQLAGILGALLAIPVAGSLLAIGREVVQSRKDATGEPRRHVVLGLACGLVRMRRPDGGCDRGGDEGGTTCGSL